MAEMLFVFLHGRRVGTLRRAPGDGVEFRYDPDALEDISISLPAGPNRVYSPNRASAFFNGLLPDGADARLRMARSFGSLDTSTYSLLSKAGLDCAGAVQVWVDDELPARYDALMPVDETRIGLRLRGLLDGVEGDESRGINERWSLSGAQSKIALRSEGGDWFIPLGNEPSTHIIKPGVVGMQGVLPGDQALAEHVTMTAARSLGVDAAMSFYFEFDGVPAIVVERFDRERDSSHQLVRVHQEDMCQALGVRPAQKYEEDGGPSAADIGALLREVASTPGQAQDDLWRFGLMIAFNYLAEAPDAHAKNFSILHTRAGLTRLAPMYDAATGAIASQPNSGQRRFTKAAMGFGGTYLFGSATPMHWGDFAQGLGLRDRESFVSSIRDMAAHLPDAFRDAIEHSGAPKGVRARFVATGVLSRLNESAAAARVGAARQGASARLVGALPVSSAKAVCAEWMPRAKRRCALPKGHRGFHR